MELWKPDGVVNEVAYEHSLRRREESILFDEVGYFKRRKRLITSKNTKVFKINDSRDITKVGQYVLKPVQLLHITETSS